jgi:hypothetical protein
MEGHMADFVKMNEDLKKSPRFSIEVLKPADLDHVVGGGPFNSDNGVDCTTGTISMCHVDGSCEPGTS